MSWVEGEKEGVGAHAFQCHRLALLRLCQARESNPDQLREMKIVCYSVMRLREIWTGSGCRAEERVAGREICGGVCRRCMQVLVA